MPFETLVGGHVARIGTRADVLVQAEFMKDLRDAAQSALVENKFGPTPNAVDKTNPWAVADNYIDRVAIQCVNTVTPKWAPRLAAFDAYIWDHCYAMIESLRAD